VFLLLIIAALSASAQTSGSIPASFFGISAVGGTYPVPTIGALGHPDFSWAEMEPSQSSIDFSQLDSYVAAAQQHGLVDPATNTAAIVFTLSRGTPSWAVNDQTHCNATSCTAPPDNIQDWNLFLSFLTQRYNGINMPQIAYYELWHEANNTVYWTGTNAQMLALAKTAYPLIHADRYSMLLTPSVVGPTQTAWMTSYLQSGGAPFADGGAFHGYIAPAGTTPYPMPEGQIDTIATQLRAVFDNFGLYGKPMLETEGSWGSANLDSATQSAWLARYILLQAGLRAPLNLQMAGWFGWADPNNGNLADSSMQPTTAGVAFGQLYNWLVGATITKPCSGVANGTWTCSFTRPGGYVAQAVWNTLGYLNYTPGLSYIQYRDLTGKTTAIAPDAFIDVGPQPILLEGTSAGTGTAPIISLIANAEGEAPIIAPNTWVEIKGINLARAGDSRIWQGSDFTNNQMPHELDGVSVSVNGKGAYLYYISPTQVNILTPPDPMSGNVPVQVTVNGIASPAITVRAQAVAPSLFVSGGGPYVAATPAQAKPGQVIVLYGNGFGATDTSVQSGLPVQYGQLTSPPSIQIGGIDAQVLYAGLIGPGEFQFNVLVPASLSAGDQPVTAIYQGFSTQPGLLLSVQP